MKYGLRVAIFTYFNFQIWWRKVQNCFKKRPFMGGWGRLIEIFAHANGGPRFPCRHILDTVDPPPIDMSGIFLCTCLRERERERQEGLHHCQTPTSSIRLKD